MQAIGHDSDLSSILSVLAHSINDVVKVAGSQIDRTMTMAFMALDLKTGTGHYLNAGHEGIMVVQGDKLKSLIRPGSPLGLTNNPSFGQTTFQLREGDRVFMYTDGLIENQGVDGSTFVKRDLITILKSEKNIETLKDNIVEQAEGAWSGNPENDDVSFLIIEWQKQDSGVVVKSEKLAN